jgi:pentapeptide MXKDX repeat protein
LTLGNVMFFVSFRAKVILLLIGCTEGNELRPKAMSSDAMSSEAMSSDAMSSEAMSSDDPGDLLQRKQMSLCKHSMRLARLSLWPTVLNRISLPEVCQCI